MVPASFARYPVCKMAGCRKYPLPSPLLACVWVFALKRIGQSDSAQASLEIAPVLSFDHIEVFGKRFSHRSGKHRVPIFVPFAGSNNYLITGEIDVFDPQPRTFHQPQTSAVKEHSHEPIRPIETAEYRSDFLARQHDR